MNALQIEQHGVPSFIVIIMVAAGLCINTFVDNEQVQIDSSWCDAIDSLSKVTIQDMPHGFQELTVVVSVVLPIVPILVNSKSDLSDIKIETLKSHFLGQSSSFGLSEIARHFTVFPEASFFTKCNLSAVECRHKQMYASNLTLLAPDDASHSLCHVGGNQTVGNELFNSLHHFPTSTGTLIGAGIVSFIASLMYWQRINKNNKTPYHNSPRRKYFLYICITLCVVVFLMYFIFLYKSFDSIQLYAVLSGGILQLLIILAMLREK